MACDGMALSAISIIVALLFPLPQPCPLALQEKAPSPSELSPPSSPRPSTSCRLLEASAGVPAREAVPSFAPEENSKDPPRRSCANKPAPTMCWRYPHLRLLNCPKSRGHDGLFLYEYAIGKARVKMTQHLQVGKKSLLLSSRRRNLTRRRQ